MSEASSNVARRLSEMARIRPEAVAVAEPLGYGPDGKRLYRSVTFAQLDADSDRIARGLLAMGVSPGTRLALLVPPSIDFVALAFGLFKSGAVTILIDPGMGGRNLIRCLTEAEPEGFIAVPMVHAVRTLLKSRFPKARWNVTVGRRWFWGGATLEQLRQRGQHIETNSRLTAPGMDIPFPATPDQPAAIIFTTGSTGPSKGVLFTHGNFDAQVEQIRARYDIQPGEVDVPCFPMFGLFNGAMGVTAVIPEMDPSRPAQADPRKIIEAISDWSATQAFGSPAVWDVVGCYCEKHRVSLPSVRRVLSAGAPVPAEVLRRMKACIHPEGDVYTPYGATEALPVASIAASEVLGTTAEQTRKGAGVCVGRPFAQIRWKVIRIVDGPIRTIDEIEELPAGKIGELIVSGPQVTHAYVTRVESNALAKIADGDNIWHRMGDSGYLDGEGRFWFCGRVAHCVRTPSGMMYPIRCEAIFNGHPAIRRSALVGVGPAGRQRPVMILEPREGRMPRSAKARATMLDEIRRLGAANPLTEGIADFLFHPKFPVDIRHNAKIFREKLAVWAASQLHG